MEDIASGSRCFSRKARICSFFCQTGPVIAGRARVGLDTLMKILCYMY